MPHPVRQLVTRRSDLFQPATSETWVTYYHKLLELEVKGQRQHGRSRWERLLNDNDVFEDIDTLT